MSPALPEGQPVPADGRLPDAALADLGRRGFGVYVHVPFCATRCGYCDFNTYTAAELGAAGGTPGQQRYLDAACAEIALAGDVLAGAPPVQTVFFGGGTPTLLPFAALARLLDQIAETFGLADDAEVTTEANPESVDAASLRELRRAGFTRVSLGMQSAVPRVLAVLDRRHTPGRAVAAAREARDAGFDHVSLDVIYGTPGESAADWEVTLGEIAKVAADGIIDHVSAYALIVEEGTRLATRVRRGDVATPDDDAAADRYLAADAAFHAVGLDWYEVSNWARDDAARCHHNRLYWTGGDWWGIGPGAHSHVGGVRWWNVKHPARYADQLAQGTSPGAGRELLDAEQRRTEEIMLRVRLVDGLPLADLDAPARDSAARFVDDGLLSRDAYDGGRVMLTLRGRLLADAVVRGLLGW